MRALVSALQAANSSSPTNWGRCPQLCCVSPSGFINQVAPWKHYGGICWSQNFDGAPSAPELEWQTLTKLHFLKFSEAGSSSGAELITVLTSINRLLLWSITAENVGP